MTEAAAPFPTDIKLHKKSRLLQISYADGLRFMYPCEYLRVSAPQDVVDDGASPFTASSGLRLHSLSHWAWTPCG